MYTRIISLLIIGLFTCQISTAQSQLTEHTLALDEGNAPASADITDFQWLAGHWQGEGFGGTVVEAWNPPLGGTMIGTFRLVKDGAPDFYEFIALLPQDGSIVYKVKHFTSALTGWEEKDETVSFPLVKMQLNTAFFHGLTIQRSGDQCTFYIALHGDDDTYTEYSLICHDIDRPMSAEATKLMALLPNNNPVPLLMLGSYHMSNPGMDHFNLEADDVLVPKRQQELQAVVDHLAEWKPTKVAVEAPYGDSVTVARYEAYLRGERVLRNSEEEQIGFRLAKQLGHKTIYPIDVRMPMNDESLKEVIGSDPAKFGPYLQSMQILGESAMSMMGKWLKEGTVGQMLYNMNDPDLLGAGHMLYFQAFVPIVNDDNYGGADMVNDWYHRNLRIFSNLHKISDDSNDRIFIVYGQGHIPLLQQFADDSPYFQVEDVQVFLRGL